MVHAPRQAHQQAIDRLLAPVGNESAAERCVERDVQLVDGHRALGDLNEIDTLDGSPPDQSEGLDKDAILIGADGGPPGLQQGNVVEVKPAAVTASANQYVAPVIQAAVKNTAANAAVTYTGKWVSSRR